MRLFGKKPKAVKARFSLPRWIMARFDAAQTTKDNARHWAAAEFLSQPQRRIRTLFATHYHEMTVLEQTLQGVRNLNVDVAEENGDIVFLHKIVPGSASRSYGIHVAKLAGAPKELLETAKLHLEALSGDMRDNVSAVASESREPVQIASEAKYESSPASEEEQLSLFAQVPDPISERIRGLDLMNTTPSQALQILEELKEYL